MTPHPLTLASIKAQGIDNRQSAARRTFYRCGCIIVASRDDKPASPRPGWYPCDYHRGYDDCTERVDMWRGWCVRVVSALYDDDGTGGAALGHVVRELREALIADGGVKR